jgi:hypothetical protein
VKLVGLDVEFSTSRATTAIAFLDGDQVGLVRTGTKWESREAQIRRDFHPSVIALELRGVL